MDQFNYLAVLISIVLGLGITQLLSGFGRWLEQRAAFHAYGPSIMWAAVLLVIHVQTWWSMFAMRTHTGWTFIEFSMVLLQPIILFLLTALVLPSPTAPERDLRLNYFNQRLWFFGLLAGLVVVSVLKDVILDGSLPDPVNLAFHGALFILAVIAMAVEREGYHRAFAYTSILFIGSYVLMLFGRLV